MKKLYMLLYLMSMIISGCAHWTIQDKLVITKNLKEGIFIKTEHKEKQHSINKFDRNTHDMLIKKVATM